MSLEPTPFIITVAELRWLCSALSRDTHRAVLGVGALAYHEGNAWLVATDTHRLHILNLGPIDEPFEQKVVDIRRILHEASFEGAKHVRLSRDLATVEVGREPSKKAGWYKPVWGPVFPEGHGPYPDFKRVMPAERRPIQEFFAINAKYLTDATALAYLDSGRTLIFGESKTRPIVFQHASERPRWTAIVMPMALDIRIEVAA